MNWSIMTLAGWIIVTDDGENADHVGPTYVAAAIATAGVRGFPQ
jgi:hypothetical protein